MVTLRCSRLATALRYIVGREGLTWRARERCGVEVKTTSLRSVRIVYYLMAETLQGKTCEAARQLEEFESPIGLPRAGSLT